ncbi:hypothetical protein [Catenulispora sp. GP43]|uniref:hypothetical protein n=1 Tax=Catenulispora sp. GP43 TaxID=3156263 RepID=UPI003514DE03
MEAIIHAHQGQVRVESTVGVGTTVTVRLKTRGARAKPRDCKDGPASTALC